MNNSPKDDFPKEDVISKPKHLPGELINFIAVTSNDRETESHADDACYSLLGDKKIKTIEEKPVETKNNEYFESSILNDLNISSLNEVADPLDKSTDSKFDGQERLDIQEINKRFKEAVALERSAAINEQETYGVKEDSAESLRCPEGLPAFQNYRIFAINNEKLDNIKNVHPVQRNAGISTKMLNKCVKAFAKVSITERKRPHAKEQGNTSVTIPKQPKMLIKTKKNTIISTAG